MRVEKTDREIRVMDAGGLPLFVIPRPLWMAEGAKRDVEDAKRLSIAEKLATMSETDLAAARLTDQLH